MKKMQITVVSLFTLFLFQCVPLAKVEREPRIRFPQTLVIMNYVKAPVNTGYEDSMSEERDRIRRIDDELEDSLNESIYSVFSQKNIFKNVLKENKNKTLPVELTNNVYRLYLENHSISLTKNFFKVKAEIVSTVSIKDFAGKNVFIKKYQLNDYRSFMGSAKSVAMDLYSQFIKTLMNDLEVQLGGLAPYTESEPQPAAPVRRQQGDFWL